MSGQIYRELKRWLDVIGGSILVERLSGFNIQEFLNIARLTSVQLGSFLSQHREINRKWTDQDIADRLRPLADNGEFPDVLRTALEEAHWDAWTRALV
jgi:hypothetical protein